MKRILPLFLGLAMCSWGFSQSISPEVTASAGDHFTGTNVQLSWTIGELMVETYDNDQIQLTQGFHQPNLIITAIEDLEIHFQVRVFPNPTAEFINLEWTEAIDGYVLLLIDTNGKQLLQQKVTNQGRTEVIPFTDYSTGSYFLQLSTPEGKTIKTFKILKIK